MIRTFYRDAVILHHRSADLQYRQSDRMPKNRSSRERSAFGSRMHEARQAAGLTQMQVKAAVGCSQGTLSELEATADSSGLVARFAELYRVLPLWLATGEGPRSAADAQQGAQAVQMVAPAAEPAPAAAAGPASLAQALEVLGMALAADMPDDVRQDAADLLAKLAHRRGAARHQEELLALLQADLAKLRRAA
jgi:transcriptional regulator with XRE-family HTH domain